ncbi:MAG: alpha/beta hydrolase [Oligoflexia bacterium]|nr:MAG: alpha/beta hydrolase [Oligoflexia bacterium]
MPMHQIKDGTNFSMNYEIIEGVLPQTTLFIHGNLASNRWWYPAEQEYRKIAKGQNCKGAMLLAEFRGCGKSSAPNSVDEVSMHTLANDFISLVQSLNLGPINIVGHSTGGLIAALMLAKAPELFNKAVLLDPVGAKGVKFDDSMTAAFEQMKASKELVGIVMASTIHNNNPETDFFKQIVVEDAFHAVKTVGLYVLKNLDGFDARQEISKIDNPVLVLHGEHDALLPVADSKELATLMKNAKFETILGQGHCTNAENPAKFVEITSKFLFN